METPSFSDRQGDRTFDDDDLELDDVTARAYSAITQQLEQFTSPRAPSASAAANTNVWTDVSAMQMNFGDDDDDDGLVITSKSAAKKSPAAAYNVMDWWNRELVDPAPNEEDNDDDNDEIALGSSGKLRVTRTTTTPNNNNNNNSYNGATPKRAPMVERAATPVMSNSSNKKKGSHNNNNNKYSATKGMNSSYLDHTNIDDSLMEEDDDMLPVNVQSPWAQQEDGSQTSGPPPSPWATGGGRLQPSTPRAIASFRNQQYEYRRYHDALLAFLKARRSLTHRIEIEKQEQALDSIMIMTADDNEDALAFPMTHPVGDAKLLQEETLADLEVLRTLKSLCWERDPLSATQAESASQTRDWVARREGNFWALLYELRSLGLAALFWADDDASLQQNLNASASFIEVKATQIHATPKELLEEMTGEGVSDAPLLLKRRKRILSWLEHCLDQLVTVETKASVSVASRSNDNNSGDALSSSNLSENSPRHLDKVMRSCFSLILAGRLQDARLLLRQAGQPWMAAKLGGGAPAGFEKVTDDQLETMELVKVGNVNRPLWKRQMWTLSEKMNQNGSGVLAEEAAIHSLLANDYQNALENPALRSWEKGLYVVFSAMWGRSEDEQLHLHNNHRRRSRPPFPGTLYEDCEQAQLKSTCQLSNMTEGRVVEMMAAATFESMRGLENLCAATSSLLVGRMELTNFLLQETELLTDLRGQSEEPVDWVSRLRFVTHVLLFLDSLSVSSTPVSLEGIHEAKNKALFAYVEHLSGHENLWNLMMLYASLLPEYVIMEYIPTVLVGVEGEEERRMMVEQSRELLPEDGMDLRLLRIVVRSILAEEDDFMTGDDDSSGNVPSRSDIRKMKSIQWLSFYEEHAGDALIAANMLLRQFLLSNKLSSASMFLQDFLPAQVVEGAMTSTGDPNKEDNVEAVAENEVYQAILGRARTEHVAFQSYLKAFRAVEEWRLVLRDTPASGFVVDDKVDSRALNDKEQSIAKSMERRQLILEKRKVSQVLLVAAETATKDVERVLKHEGGWLADLDADTRFNDSSPEGVQRKNDMKVLRSRMLPYAVKLYQEVCDETASWMWSSLLDGLPAIGSTPKDVLEALDETTTSTTEDEVGYSLSSFSPRYWTRLALDLVETVASDEYLVLKSYGSADLKEMLAKVSNIALSDLRYSA